MRFGRELAVTRRDLHAFLMARKPGTMGRPPKPLPADYVAPDEPGPVGPAPAEHTDHEKEAR